MATTFTYEAIDASGALVKGRIEAASQDAAAGSLASQRLIPLKVAGLGTGLSRDVSVALLRRRTSLRDLAVFARQFASMTSAGLTLLRCLSILESQTRLPRFTEVISRVRTAVQGGETLSSAMAEHPDHFPPLMVNMIRSGETGGFLDEALDRIATMYEADAYLRAKIRSASTYPVIVMGFSLLLASGVIVFVVPIFERMFRQLGGQLPLPTRIMVSLSHNAFWLGPVLLVAALVGLQAFRHRVRHHPPFRLAVDRAKLRLPVFGRLFTKLAISRWARNLGTLLGVGVPVLQALDVVGESSGNATVTEAMTEVAATVRAGGRMSDALDRHPLFSAMVVSMVQMGEESGQITEMLDKLADYYDREVETATESLTSALEPILVVLLGAVIGSMVICLYLPMFTVYQHIGT